jgi:DMSO/TMAO reductase YedYZ molybdopterin-dependent catalytic subunit
MEQNPIPPRLIKRRRLLQLSGASSIGLLLGGCASADFAELIGNISEPLNQKMEELLLRPQTPVPEFPVSAIEPKALLVNTYDETPEINPKNYSLIIDGEVQQPLQLSLGDIKKLPPKSMVIRHVCVEGWSAIVQWGGVRLRDLVALAEPKSTVRYIYFESADKYLESWDIASALHPQTILAYSKNGEPLSIANGAPLRLASPIKLGYKQSKWVTKITFVNKLGSRRGFWEDQGYEWFGGL